jgi:hypothetical protein
VPAGIEDRSWDNFTRVFTVRRPPGYCIAITNATLTFRSFSPFETYLSFAITVIVITVFNPSSRSRTVKPVRQRNKTVHRNQMKTSERLDLRLPRDITPTKPAADGTVSFENATKTFRDRVPIVFTNTPFGWFAPGKSNIFPTQHYVRVLVVHADAVRAYVHVVDSCAIFDRNIFTSIHTVRQACQTRDPWLPLLMDNWAKIITKKHFILCLNCVKEKCIHIMLLLWWQLL